MPNLNYRLLHNSQRVKTKTTDNHFPPSLRHNMYLPRMMFLDPALYPSFEKQPSAKAQKGQKLRRHTVPAVLAGRYCAASFGKSSKEYRYSTYRRTDDPQASPTPFVPYLLACRQGRTCNIFGISGENRIFLGEIGYIPLMAAEGGLSAFRQPS